MSLKQAPFFPELDARLAAIEAVAGVAPAANVANLTGTLTGSVDGALADVAAIALSTSDTYADADVNTAVNTAITAINLQLKELQTTQNALLTSLRTAGIIA